MHDNDCPFQQIMPSFPSQQEKIYSEIFLVHLMENIFLIKQRKNKKLSVCCRIFVHKFEQREYICKDSIVLWRQTCMRIYKINKKKNKSQYTIWRNIQLFAYS